MRQAEADARVLPGNVGHHQLRCRHRGLVRIAQQVFQVAAREPAVTAVTRVKEDEGAALVQQFPQRPVRRVAVVDCVSAAGCQREAGAWRLRIALGQFQHSGGVLHRQVQQGAELCGVARGQRQQAVVQVTRPRRRLRRV
ncbi:hypothetical protein D3C81_1711270 [compost metagenome]